MSDDADEAALVCHHVAAGLRPTLAVFRHADGDWSFTCGLPDHVAESWLPLDPPEVEARRAALPDLPALAPARMAWRAEAEDRVWHVEALAE